MSGLEGTMLNQRWFGRQCLAGWRLPVYSHHNLLTLDRENDTAHAIPALWNFLFQFQCIDKTKPVAERASDVDLSFVRKRTTSNFARQPDNHSFFNFASLH